MSRSLILMYHAVDEPSAPGERSLCVTPHAFALQMRWLRQSVYRPVALDEVVNCLEQHRPLPANTVAVTFDDGFADVYEHAMPILRRHAIPATMFVVAGLLGRTNEWMKRREYPTRRIVSDLQLRELDGAGMTIGSHTLTHPRMIELSLPEAVSEARESKSRLEDLLGKPVRHFAYPYGLCNDPVKEAVRGAGYASASSTRSGFNSVETDRFELRRIDVLGNDSLAQFRRKISFGANRVSAGMLIKYYAGRIRSRLRT